MNPARTSDAAGTPPVAPTAAAPAEAKSRTVAITEAAANEIRNQREKRGDPAAMIRIGIRGGGCTGYTYVFEWAEKIRASDKVVEAHGVSVVVDPKSLVYLAGMELDFVRGMMGHGFKFNNPNVKGDCGCGESVQF